MEQGVFKFLEEARKKDENFEKQVDKEIEIVHKNRKKEEKKWRKEQREKRYSDKDMIVDFLADYTLIKGISTKKFAKMIKVSPETASGWFNLKHRPQLRSQIKMKHFIKEVDKKYAKQIQCR